MKIPDKIINILYGIFAIGLLLGVIITVTGVLILKMI